MYDTSYMLLQWCAQKIWTLRVLKQLQVNAECCIRDGCQWMLLNPHLTNYAPKSVIWLNGLEMVVKNEILQMVL